MPGIPEKLVGAAGFEPTTTRTPSECATGLRYAPNDCLGLCWVVQNLYYLAQLCADAPHYFSRRPRRLPLLDPLAGFPATSEPVNRKTLLVPHSLDL
jgi:hypothetical protein